MVRMCGTKKSDIIVSNFEALVSSLFNKVKENCKLIVQFNKRKKEKELNCSTWSRDELENCDLYQLIGSNRSVKI